MINRNLHRLSVLLLAGLLTLAMWAAVPVAGDAPATHRPPWVENADAPTFGASARSEPYSVAVQGLLTDPDSGLPLEDGPVTLHLALYRQAAGGEAFWDETHEVTLQGGVFSLFMGSVRGDLFPEHFVDSTYLGIAVGAGSEMTPRQPLAVVPEALLANMLRPGANWQGETADPLLGLENTGAGVGIYVSSASSNGLVGQSTLTDTVGLSGLSTYGSGLGGFSSYGNGGYFASVESSGVVGNSIFAGTAGVEGTSNGGAGVRGISEMGPGGHFSSTSNMGLYARTSSATDPAIQGKHTGGGAGVEGQSVDGYGVGGHSGVSFGVYGSSDGDSGGFFTSTGAPGLRAVSSSASSYDPALQATNLGSGPGLWAESSENNGVQGNGSFSNGSYGGYFVGHGGVYAQGVGGPAITAAGPIVSSSPSYLWTGGMAFHVMEEEGVTATPQADGGISLSSTAPATVQIYGTFTVPAVLYGNDMSVTGLRIQYRSSHAESYVDRTTLALGGGGGSRLIVDDETDHNATADGASFDPPLRDEGYEELSANDGILGLELTVRLGAAGQSVTLYGARLTVLNQQEGK